MAGVLGQPGVLGHEPEELAVRGVEAAERHVLQAVEVVLGGVLGQLQKRREEEEENINTLFIC